jgi:uncharacterized membrane protein YeaQ/YmgE (transglycosylase-associated protein family)
MTRAAELPARLRAPGSGSTDRPRRSRCSGPEATDLSILAWIALGTIAGLVASQLASGRGQSWALDLTLGIASAILAGLLFDLFGAGAAAGSDASDMLVASLGSVAVLATHHLLFNRASA